MFDRAAMISELQRDEGVRNYPYVDTTGHVTIGVGRNLSTDGLSDSEVSDLLGHDIDEAVDALNTKLPWWTSLDDIRQRAILNMAFNLGVQKLCGFVHFLAALRAGQWQEAVVQMQDSLWAKQVGARATRLEQMILTGNTGA